MTSNLLDACSRNDFFSYKKLKKSVFEIGKIMINVF
jgi:hypothetical protein